VLGPAVPFRRRRAALAGVLAGALSVGALTAIAVAPPATAAARSTVLQSAAAYGPAHGYKVGIAVYDTKTNKVYGSGSYKSTFASESVIKAMIATRLLLQGRMHGTTATRAYKMITQSDDAIASSFYGSVGGDGLINWIKRHYGVPDLGSPPHRAGWWGNTHITAIGLVKFYAKVKKDRRVGPWLLNAMHHARKYGSDGTYQFFGIPSATTGFAVKQGWGIDYDDWSRSADFNTTGFVNGDRYAVAILARGPSRTYGGAIGNMLTQTARRLLPGGRFPDPDPAILHMSHRSGTTLGGQAITVSGRDFTSASAVLFGSTKGTSLRVRSATSLSIVTPPHPAGRVSVRVVTGHGTSSVRSYYTFVRPPVVTQISPANGPEAGKTTVTVRGTDFTNVYSVWVGSHRAATYKVLSSTTISLTTPAGTGTVPIRVHTWYGWTSATAPAAQFTYTPPTVPASPAPATAAPPTVSSGATPTAPTSGGAVTAGPAATSGAPSAGG
jgi:hypothetical protein